jgi:hypothetical protein
MIIFIPIFIKFFISKKIQQNFIFFNQSLFQFFVQFYSFILILKLKHYMMIILNFDLKNYLFNQAKLKLLH